MRTPTEEAKPSVRPALARLLGRPLAMAPRAIDGLLAGSMTTSIPSALFPPRDEDGPRRGSYAVTDSGIAVVPIHGPLLTRADWLSALFGATSYDEAAGTIATAFADPGVRAVLLEIDSPGGEVGGLFDLVDDLAAFRADVGKPLWAVARESALSAAYAIASAAERIYVTRTGEVGSIGVVAAHLDESGADAMAGLKWTLIHAGERKIDANSHEPLSSRAHTDIQADVDALHDELVELVARNRNTTAAAIRATEAAIYRGERGRAAGLADRVGGIAQALADLAEHLESKRPPTGTARSPSVHQPRRRMPDMTAETSTEPAAEDPAANVPTPEAPTAAPVPAAVEPAIAPASPAASAGNDAAARLRAEYAEIASVTAQAGRLGVDIDAADAMARGIAPDALRRSVLETLAARSDAGAVVSSTPAAPAPGAESPIVRRARERAAAQRT